MNNIKNKKKKKLFTDFDLYKSKKDRLLKITNKGFLIIKLFFPNIKRIGNKCKNVLNPLYNDKNAGLSFYTADHLDRWYYKDFGDPEFQGDIFDFAKKVWDIEHFDDLLDRIERELKQNAAIVKDLITKETPAVEITYSEDKSFELQELKELSPKHIKWLNKYGICEAIFDELGCRFIKGYTAYYGEGMQKGICSANELMIAFKGEDYAKIYTLNIMNFSKKIRYVGNKPRDYSFGFNYGMLKDAGIYGLDVRVCIITGGEKDVLTFQSYGYPAVCFNSETDFNVEERIRELKSIYSIVIVCYDIDETGLNASEHLCKEYNLKRIILPEELLEKEGKDISDYVALGLDFQVIHNMINEIVKEEGSEISWILEKSGNSKSCILDEILVNPKKQGYSTENVEELFKEKSSVREEDNNSEQVEEAISYKSSESYKSSDSQNEENQINTSCIPLSVHENLPLLLKSGCNWFEKQREKDIFLISALTIISGCLPNLFGFYDTIRTKPNLYTFLMAPASAGKGSAAWAKRLVNPLLDYFKECYKEASKKYKKELSEYLNKKEKNGLEEPVEPKRYIHFIPADTSTSAIIKTICDNGGKGTIFETEADCLVESLKQQHGSFSHILRSAYHHEKIGLLRKTNDEHIDNDNPQLTILLTGTPEQFFRLVPNPENGLLSRICIYSFDSELYWKNPFEEKNNYSREESFKEIGIQLLNLYKNFESIKEVEFKLTPDQIKLTCEVFSKWKLESHRLFGKQSIASIHRLGVIEFRIAMILSALRVLETGSLSEKLVCSDVDFESAFKIAEIFKTHALTLLKQMTKRNTLSKIDGIQLEYYQALPSEFNRNSAMNKAVSLSIKEKAAERYLNIFVKKGLLLKPRHNVYRKKE